MRFNYKGAHLQRASQVEEAASEELVVKEVTVKTLDRGRRLRRFLTARIDRFSASSWVLV